MFEKCKNDTVAMGEDCIGQTFGYLKNESEIEWINGKSKSVIDENELKLMAHTGSGFASWVFWVI